MATDNGAAGGKAKGKKNKGTKLDINSVVDPSAFKMVEMGSWADEMENEEIRVPIVQLPTAPKATTGADIDYDSLPNHPPFKCFVFNISFESTPGQLERFFSHLPNVKVTMGGGREGERPAGNAHVEFESRNDLIEALKMNGKTMGTRQLKIQLPQERMGGGFGGRDGGGRRNFPDNTPSNWRNRDALPPKTSANAPPPTAPEFEGRSGGGGFGFRNNSYREREGGFRQNRYGDEGGFRQNRHGGEGGGSFEFEGRSGFASAPQRSAPDFEGGNRDALPPKTSANAPPPNAPEFEGRSGGGFGSGFRNNSNREGGGFRQDRNGDERGFRSNRNGDEGGGFRQNRYGSEGGPRQNRHGDEGGFRQNREEGGFRNNSNREGGFRQNRSNDEGGFRQNRYGDEGGFRQNRYGGEGGTWQHRDRASQPRRDDTSGWRRNDRSSSNRSNDHRIDTKEISRQNSGGSGSATEDQQQPQQQHSQHRQERTINYQNTDKIDMKEVFQAITQVGGEDEVAKPTSYNSIFGGAKPVETSQKDMEIERKLAEERQKKEADIEAAKKAAAEKKDAAKAAEGKAAAEAAAANAAGPRPEVLLDKSDNQDWTTVKSSKKSNHMR